MLKLPARQHFQRAFAGIRRHGFKALAAQEGIQQAALARVVVHDEDARRFGVIVFARFGGHAGKLTETPAKVKKEFSPPLEFRLRPASVDRLKPELQRLADKLSALRKIKPPASSG